MATIYNRCGKSGVLLPKVSLGFWHNFGDDAPFERSRAITRYAFDHGVTHFDFANNYGVPGGSAEANFGRLMDESVKGLLDELTDLSVPWRRTSDTKTCTYCDFKNICGR